MPYDTHIREWQDQPGRPRWDGILKCWGPGYYGADVLTTARRGQRNWELVNIKGAPGAWEAGFAFPILGSPVGRGKTRAAAMEDFLRGLLG